MPMRQIPRARLPAAPLRVARVGFRRQVRDLERQRAILVARLLGLGEDTRTHPSYKRALNLLNEKFQGASVAQRRAVLDAADWLIGLLDRLNAPAGPAPDYGQRKIKRVLRGSAGAVVGFAAPRARIPGRPIGGGALPK
jgi:hypothetical protein